MITISILYRLYNSKICFSIQVNKVRQVVIAITDSFASSGNIKFDLNIQGWYLTTMFYTLVYTC